MEKNYTSLKKLVGQEFTVEGVYGYKYKMYVPGENRFLTSDTWQEGYSKKWQMETNKGELEVSDYQFGNMLANAFNYKEQTATLTGLTFSVKSNGKEGMEIRYYINPVFNKKPQPVEEEPDIIVQDITDEPVNLDSIPF